MSDTDKEFKPNNSDLLKNCLSIMTKEMVKPSSEVSVKSLDKIRSRIDQIHDEKRLTNLVEFS